MPRAIHFLLLTLIVSTAHAADITAQQILDRIQAKFGADWSKTTVDTVKAGDPAIKVTGITTTMFPSLELLKKSVAAGNNLVICHEPCFYNHKDDLGPLENDEIQKAKLAFIKANNMLVFRFHDHSHRIKPEGIVAGVLEQLGWKDFPSPEKNLITIPATTVEKLAKELKEKLKASAVRVVGDRTLPCSKVALSVGAAGTLTHILWLQRDDVDVLVAGEAREWETVEYMRDANTAGKKKALILLGHNASEEPGMNFVAKWLSEFVTQVPIKFIESGDPFWTP